MNGEYTGVLTCSTCGRDTVHHLHYAGRILAMTVCAECGSTVRREEHELRAAYARDLAQRLVTKPHRMWRRLCRHPLRFGAGLPGSMIAKPRRMYRELKLVAPAHEQSSRARTHG